VSDAPQDILKAISDEIARMASQPSDNGPVKMVVSKQQADLMAQAGAGTDLSAWATAWYAHNSTLGRDVIVEVVGDAPLEPVQPFLHTEVRARYPSGTDPLAAIRESMGVFMERRDGTNAMEWWQQRRWWHGSRHGFKRGDLLLPPSETGVLPALGGTDVERVYITSSRDDALLYAARHERPMLYEVTLREEPIFDDVMPGTETSKRVPVAKVYRAEQPSRVEIGRAMFEMDRAAEAVLAEIEAQRSADE